jgi:hypothetical protein
MQETPKTINPGINPNTELAHFTQEEQEIIKRFATEWYVTSSGNPVKLGATSTYKYFLIKPISVYQELFNIEREIVVIFSNYDTFEPRTLDAFDYVVDRYQELRIEKVCSVLVSKDVNIASKIRDLLKSAPEYQIVVPFYFGELLDIKDDYFVRNRFRENFYSRDLFAFQSPLKKDLYFFGRTDLVHKIVNRHRSSENSGLFGLRKTGKTSIIFGIRRVIGAHNGISVFIDCQSPSFHRKRWFSALRYVAEEIKDQNKVNVSISDESRYSEENAASAFERDLSKISGRLKQKKFLIIFDETE